MNVHHLELFYFVATHGGISRAVRRMPYGIQQPAVSSQILLLEQDLGVKLFERTPFKLTREGEQLLAFVQPFFGNLQAIEAKLRKRAAPLLRLGAAEMVLRDHLPAVMQRLRARHPGFHLSLRSGFQADMETWLQNREIDIAITPLEARPPARLRCLRLMRLPLVLLLPKKSKIKSAGELWARREIEEPLISLPPTEPLCRLFRKGLQQRRVAWPHAIEASSMDLVTRYVANGYGIGLSVNITEVIKHPQVRVLPLEDFDRLEVVALWSGEPSPLVRVVLEEAQHYVGQTWPEWRCADALPA